MDAESALGRIEADAHPVIRAAYRRHVRICIENRSPIVPWATFRGEMEEYPDILEDAKKEEAQGSEPVRWSSSLRNDE
jgi:hypothetical protein